MESKKLSLDNRADYYPKYGSHELNCESPEGRRDIFRKEEKTQS